MPEVRLEITDERLRGAIEAHRDTILECSFAKVMAMDHKELRDIVAGLVVTMLAEEIEWLHARGLACAIRVTEDEHVFGIRFARRADALRFQIAWGGELCEEERAASVH